MKPLRPSWMISGTEPARHATQGVPHDMASIITSRTVPASLSGTAAHVRCPGIHTCRVPRFLLRTRRGAARTAARSACGSSRRSAASILAAMRIFMPARRAISMARSGRFSGENAARGTPRSRRRARGLKATDIGWQSVMHRAHPMTVRKRSALLIGNRHQRQIAEGSEQCRIVRQIEPSVHGGDDVAGTQQPCQRQVQEITVDMNHVEFVGTTPQLLELQRGVNQRFPDVLGSNAGPSERRRATPPSSPSRRSRTG